MARFRYAVAALIFGSTLTLYIGRINLSTAIVAMSHPVVTNSSDSGHSDVCYQNDKKKDNPFNDTTISTTPAPSRKVAPQYDWNAKKQGLILGAFFWGYFLLQVPGGRLAETFGPRLLASGGILGTGIINFATPILADYDVAFIASRAVLGAIQAMVFPSCFVLAAQWFPDHERGTVLSLTSVGGAIGTIIASSMSGYLSEHGFAGGWPSVFYVSGVICCAYSVFIFFFIRNRPEEHPFLSSSELIYIQDNIEALKKERENVAKSVEDEDESFPWRDVLTCRAVWGEICVKMSMTWLYSLGMLKAPDYMSTVLRMSLIENGFYSSIIFAFFAASHLAGGALADLILTRRLIKDKTTVRKLFETLATFGSGIFVGAVPLFGCDTIMFLVMICLSMIFYGMQAGGEIPLPSDMSAKYSATLFGLANMCGMTTGFIGPYVIGGVIDSAPEHRRRQWAGIFYFTAAFNILGGIIFLLLGSAKPQEFGAKRRKQIEENDKEYGTVNRAKQH